MTAPPRPAIWLSALAVAVFQVGGTIGASANQPERRGIDALAVVLPGSPSDPMVELLLPH